MGANTQDLVDVYMKQIRCVLELAVPAWQGGLSQEEKTDLERIKKTACHIILGQSYDSYTAAMDSLQLKTLEFRRNFISLKSSLKAKKHLIFIFWFKPSEKKVKTRQNATKYCPVVANHARFEKSPLSFLTKLLNIYYSK